MSIGMMYRLLSTSIEKKMKFWNPNSTLQFKQYKLTFKRSKTCQPACRNLDRRGWCMGWKCVGGIFLDFATVLSKCKELAFVHKKIRYRKDFPLRNATSNSILVIRWKNIVIKCGAMFFSAKSNWSLNASERQYQTNNIMTASLQKVVRSLQRASVKLWSLQQLKWYF